MSLFFLGVGWLTLDYSKVSQTDVLEYRGAPIVEGLTSPISRQWSNASFLRHEMSIRKNSGYRKNDSARRSLSYFLLPNGREVFGEFSTRPSLSPQQKVRVEMWTGQVSTLEVDGKKVQADNNPERQTGGYKVVGLLFCLVLTACATGTFYLIFRR